LLKAVQVYALLKGRTFVTPDDVKAMAVPVLSNRIIAKGFRASGRRGGKSRSGCSDARVRSAGIRRKLCFFCSCTHPAAAVFGGILAVQAFNLRGMVYKRSISQNTAFEGVQISMIEDIENNNFLPIAWMKAESRIVRI
jgi:hypothetical protein